MAAHTLEFHDDAADFLAAAGDWLSRRPVEATIVATVAHREAQEAAAGSAPAPTGPHWWLAVRDASDEVVGAAMRTAPFEPHPPYVLSMPDEAARGLARALHERGEPVAGVNGVLPAVRLVAEEAARLTGSAARVFESVRLWEVGRLADVRDVPGGLRPARADEARLVRDWFAAFGPEAAAQAGHADPHPVDPTFDEAAARARIERGEVWLWEVNGEVVHLTNVKPPAYGVVGIGPVYTPGPHRGHGYATAAVAAATRRALDDGHRVCLFTDVDNPVSNRIYAGIGYEPLADTANYLVET